ncbi:MAG: hypothetical protein JXX28_10350 [Deltaproteobacteria bacterium]|nr:hypothetical protein [Deltaproteobacteria bacterium]
MSAEGAPVLPHLAVEFTTWLWWHSEQHENLFDLGEPIGTVNVWVDQRLAFRNPDEAKVLAVMTGENASITLEARAALAGGKVLHEVRLGFRRDEREYLLTLKGAELHITQLKLPQVVGGGEEAIHDRMFLYEEAYLVVGALFRQFTALRTAPEWGQEVLPALQRWVRVVDDLPGRDSNEG